MDKKPTLLQNSQQQPPRGTVRQGVMNNTKVGRSGGPKPSVQPLDTEPRGPRSGS